MIFNNVLYFLISNAVLELMVYLKREINERKTLTKLIYKVKKRKVFFIGQGKVRGEGGAGGEGLVNKSL